MGRWSGNGVGVAAGSLDPLVWHRGWARVGDGGSRHRQNCSRPRLSPRRNAPSFAGSCLSRASIRLPIHSRRGQPGELIRSEEFYEYQLPEGVSAVRILYHSRSAGGRMWPRPAWSSLLTSPACRRVADHCLGPRFHRHSPPLRSFSHEKSERGPVPFDVRQAGLCRGGHGLHGTGNKFQERVHRYAIECG